MSIGEWLVLALVGMSAFGALTLVIYARLPNAIYRMAERHGRYAGLGTVETRAASTPGNSPAAHVGSLQGQSA